MEDFLWIKLKILLCLYFYLTGNEVFARGGICPGGRYTLVCSTNHIFLEWSVRTTSQPSQPETRSVSSFGQNPVILPIRVILTNLEFSRDSPEMTLPLVSTMTIDSVNNDLEGTVISCTGQNSSVSSVILMKTVHVIDINRDVPNPPVIAIRSNRTHFENGNFTVTLEWPQFSGETYSVAAVPEAVHMMVTGNAQLVMLYNTEYNVTVTATLCGHRSASNFTTIHYAQCDSLLTDTRIDIIGTLPALQGQNFTINCSGELLTSQCSEGGRWDPDPREVCKNATTYTAYSVNCGEPLSMINVSLNYNSTLEGSMLRFSCVEGYLPNDVFLATCHPNGSWVPDPTSHVCTSATAASGTPLISVNQDQDSVVITATVVSSFIMLSSLIVLFIIGCICTIRWHGRCCKHISSQSDPMYDEIPSTAVNPQVQKKTFELKQNVAYGPILTQSK